MKSVNLYALTRKLDEEVLPVFEKCLSFRESQIRVRHEELQIIRDIANKLIGLKIAFSRFDNWFYSFSIPQISKEFDLLKIGTNNTVVNIELKGQEVEFPRIARQLTQNRYYLSNLSREIYIFTCVRTNNGCIEVYKLDGDTIRSSSFEELKDAIELIDKAIDSRIEELFRPRDYLISPINTPKRFLAGEYFLTNQQEEIKTRILSGINEGKKLWGINGGAGTGKTLLLYDIAKALSSQYQICVIHSGILAEGHLYLNLHWNRVSIIDAKHINKAELMRYDVICIDESQRLYKSAIDDVLEVSKDRKLKGCIFLYDYAQCLSIDEKKRNNPERLRQVFGFSEEKLSAKIRMNKEMSSFIRTMLRLKDIPQKPMNYDCVDILYANSDEEADVLLSIYRNKEYKFITLTPSSYYPNEIDHFADNDNSHQVIGQEFDNVVIVLDNNFRYDENGELEGKPHPNPNYLFPQLFYQNITRAREKLCIIVLNNPEILKRLLEIKNNTLTTIR